MISYQKLHRDLLDGKITLENISDEKRDHYDYASRIITARRIDPDELKAFIQICLDYYTYSDSGDVLIPDRLYDECTERYYQEVGKKRETQFIYADKLEGATKWDFINHEISGLVSTLPKIYSYDELKGYREFYNETQTFRIAPKYDGVSCAIKVQDHKIVYGATRYDGYQGQNLTRLITKASNIREFLEVAKDGYYKCEILMSNEQFNSLITHKKYANRRSAVSGICNTPKNVEFGKYLTIMPLLYYNPIGQKRKYIAPGIRTLNIYSTRDLMDEIESMLETIRANNFPFRVDGVVIYPKISESINEGDLMEHCIAYKVNTNEAKTQIEYGYMSVGRLGSVVPMLKVKPVEVNETIVTDVSLGSYAKFLSMNLHEHEDVIVYSAGDVIPQVKLPLIRTNWDNAYELKLPKHCPYCNQKFSRAGSEYRCTNSKCPRVISGRIANFIDKLGIVGFSDKTIEILNQADILHNIEELFKLTYDDIYNVPGFDVVSAENLINEIHKLRERRITVSELFGALGIEGISIKKCRKIFNEISLKKLLKNPEKRSISSAMKCADGIGPRTAEIFTEFVSENIDTIRYLLDTMNISGDTSYIGSVTFTGFRNSKWEEKFNSIGYEVTDSVTNDTECLISANDDRRSTKCQTAMRKAVPIFGYREIEWVYDHLKSGKRIKGEIVSI